MIVKNEYIKIKADKEITITNYIYDKYLEFVAKAQYDKSYMDFSMIRCYLKFDTAFDDIDEKETTDFDMVFPFSSRNISASENTIEANYTFTPRENIAYNPVTFEDITDFSEYIGRKITAIGFETTVNYNEYIVACVDTSNYSTYFVENISFQRKDVFTSDTTIKDGTPINLAPFSNKNIVITDARGDHYYYCYPALYSIGLGTRRGEMQEEYIIKRNDVEQDFTINLGNIELCKINNYQDKIYRTSGKNLAKINPRTGAGITVNYDESNGKLEFYGTPTEYTWIKFGNDTNVSYGSGKFTLSIQEAKEYDVNVRLYYTSSSFRSLTIPAGSLSATYDMGSDEVIKISWYLQLVEGKAYSNEVLYIQLEKGSTATDYEPYGSDKWYLHKEIGKVVLGGTENWVYHSKNSSRTNTTLFSLNNAIDDMEQVGYDYNTYCNYFTPTNVYRNDRVGYFVHYGSGHSYIYCSIDRSTVSDLAGWKNWLSEHNTEIYYILEEPTLTEITDTELIEQLEAIELHDGVNNITITGDLAGDLQIYYNYTTTGKVAKGHNLNIDVDITKDYWLGSLFGDTYQEESPTPTTPQNIKVVTGNQNIKVKSKTSLEPNEVEIIIESNTSFGFNLRRGLESNKYPSITTYAGNNLYPLPLKVDKELQPHNKLYTGSSIVPLLSDYKYIMYKYRYYYYDDFMDSYIDLDEYFITNLPNDTKGLFEIVTKIERSDV